MTVARIGQRQRAREFGAPGSVPLRLLDLPWKAPDGQPVRTRVHEALADRFMLACLTAAKESPWRPRRADGYNFRPIRDRLAPSLHGSGLAVDFFATPWGVIPPGGVWTPEDGVPVDFARCFTRLGFAWGAEFSGRRDVPHIEWPGTLADAHFDWSTFASYLHTRSN